MAYRGRGSSSKGKKRRITVSPWEWRMEESKNSSLLLQVVNVWNIFKRHLNKP